MESKPFRFHPEAREEFRSAIRWYRARNRQASSEFRVAVSDTIRLIAKVPQRRMKYFHGTRRFVVQRFPFSVIYLDDPDVVIIIAVAHRKRKPGYWKGRL